MLVVTDKLSGKCNNCGVKKYSFTRVFKDIDWAFNVVYCNTCLILRLKYYLTKTPYFIGTFRNCSYCKKNIKVKLFFDKNACDNCGLSITEDIINYLDKA